jgi:hypothetical protein
MNVYIWEDVFWEYSYSFVNKSTSQLQTDWWTWNGMWYPKFNSYWFYDWTSWGGVSTFKQDTIQNYITKANKITLTMTSNRVSWNMYFQFWIHKSISWGASSWLIEIYNWYDSRKVTLRWTNLYSTTATTGSLTQSLVFDIANKTWSVSDGSYSNNGTLTDTQIGYIQQCIWFHASAGINWSGSWWNTNIKIAIE